MPVPGIPQGLNCDQPSSPLHSIPLPWLTIPAGRNMSTNEPEMGLQLHKSTYTHFETTTLEHASMMKKCSEQHALTH